MSPSFACNLEVKNAKVQLEVSIEMQELAKRIECCELTQKNQGQFCANVESAGTWQ